jgi:hypothetical protein
MNTWLLSASSLLGAVLWLALLVVTAFSTIVLSIGLLGALYILNASTGLSRNDSHFGRTSQRNRGPSIVNQRLMPYTRTQRR